MAGFHLLLSDQVRVEFVTKRIFFDQVKVLNATHKAEVGVMSRFGAFVRRTARTIIRRTKGKASLPGQPPRSHSREPNLRTILFAYEPEAHRVVVGPVLLNGRSGSVIRGIVPPVLEFGGELKVIEKRIHGRWIQTARSRRDARAVRIRTIKIHRRPYMRTALRLEAPKFPSLWANRVRDDATGSAA